MSVPAPPRTITGLGFGSQYRINPAYVEWLEARLLNLAGELEAVRGEIAAARLEARVSER